MTLPERADDAAVAATRERRVTKSAAAFRTISEVAADLDVPPHVLRFWESKFPQIRPLKRGGGRRYYRPEDVELLRRIRVLLYRDGYTIKGVQKLLRQPGARTGEGEGTEIETVETQDMLPERDVPTAAASAPRAPVEQPRRREASIPALAAVPPPPTAPLDAEARLLVHECISDLEDIRSLLARTATR
jgi:DNA-binding transcriptional MerR regulator